MITWDVPINQEIEYFDPTLSYELTKYRPVDETRGLDFNPEWFQQAKRVKVETGKYCAYPFGTKKYKDFWDEEFRRCQEGMEVNGCIREFLVNAFQQLLKKRKETYMSYQCSLILQEKHIWDMFECTIHVFRFILQFLHF